MKGILKYGTLIHYGQGLYEGELVSLAELFGINDHEAVVREVAHKLRGQIVKCGLP
jgi:hypothetical protein